MKIDLDQVVSEDFLVSEARMRRIGVGVFVRDDVKVDLLRRIMVVDGKVFDGPIQKNWNRAWVHKLTGGEPLEGVVVGPDGILRVRGVECESLVPEVISRTILSR